MNIKFFKRLGLLTLMGLTLVACSQSNDESVATEEREIIDEDGLYHYQMVLNCDAPVDDESATRAVTYNWDNGAMLFVRFKSGSSYIAGTATYSQSENTWDVAVSSTLPTTSTDTNCQFYYFTEAGNVTSNSVAMTERTACYYTTTATYKHPTATSISMNAMIDKKTWRLRFQGTSGTSITLPGDQNDIKFYSSFNRTSAIFTSAKKDVSLTVGSNGYTPYIYGEFSNTGSNRITVVNGNSGFYRDIAASNLKVGESGYFTIPTASSYSGWTPISNRVANCKLEPGYMCAFPYGMTTSWVAGDKVATSYMTIYKKSAYADFNGDEEKIIASIKDGNTARTNIAEYISTYKNENWFTPNTEYVLCTISYDSSGREGELVSVPFSTRSLTLPLAEISNLIPSTINSNNVWRWNVALKNNASAYYLYFTEDSEDYNETNDYFEAWFVSYLINNQSITDTYTYTDPYITRSSSYATVLTWAVNSAGTIGNFSLAKTSASQSASSVTMKHLELVKGKPSSVDVKKDLIMCRQKDIVKVILN